MLTENIFTSVNSYATENNQEDKVKVHFKNLDALRFLAFLSVFLFHSFWTNVPTIQENHYYQGLHTATRVGYLGVNFFFVLSGFLISYLLLHEEEIYGHINLKNFYLRRILRIWPLFYLLTAVLIIVAPLAIKLSSGKVLDPNVTSWRYFLFLSNFDLIQHGESKIPTLNTLWTISIEEQFYLVWPVLCALFRGKKFIFPMVTIIIATLIFRFLHTDNYHVLQWHTLSVISDMALGGVLAYFCFYHADKVKLIAGKLTLFFTVLIYICLIGYAYYSSFFISNPFMLVIDRLVLGLFFVFVIFEQVYSLNSFFKVGRIKAFTNLGKITYGLYCYHYLCIFATLKIGQLVGWNKKVWGVLLLDNLTGFLISIIVASLSYQYFEKRFLKFKSRISLSA